MVRLGEEGPEDDTKEGGPDQPILDEGDCNPRGGGCDRDCLGVDGIFGGDESGVRNCARAMCSKKASSCFKDRALCRVSRGLIGGTPPNPSILDEKERPVKLSCRSGEEVDPDITAVEKTGTAGATIAAAFCCRLVRKLK